MQKSPTFKNILRFSVFFIFIGRAWQHLFWDAPYRALFWDEALLKTIVENVFSTPWQVYVTSETTDINIQKLVLISGFIYLIAAISSLFYERFKYKILRFFIFLGGMNLLMLSYLLMKENFYHFGQFFEQGIQFSLPFVFVYAVSKKVDFKKVIFVLKVLIAIVFVSHGLYAVGYYPVPGRFIDMVIQIFSVSELASRNVLLVAGAMDFIIAVLIFLPKFSRIALWYACIWGLLTAFARIVSGFQIDFMLQSIHQEFHGTLYRLAHGLVPLCVLLLEGNKEKN